VYFPNILLYLLAFYVTVFVVDDVVVNLSFVRN